MRDWREYVRGHLVDLSLSTREASETVEELASHLEESYAALIASGMSEDEAFEHASSQVRDWVGLCREILSAKQEGKMNERTRQFWLPSLVTLITAFAVLAVIIRAGLLPMVSRAGESRRVIFCIPWLLVLPLIGAGGGYLSRRAGGTGLRMYFAGAFPSLAIAATFLMFFPFAFVIDPGVIPYFKFSSLAAETISWVVLPGMALSIGVALQGLLKTQIAAR